MRNKKRNSPQLANAIARVIHFAHEMYGGWYSYHYAPYAFGMSVFEVAYKADKYDVLNSLVCVERNKIVTFCRRDIRHSFDRYKLFCDWILALVIFHLLVSLLITLCY